MSRVARGRKKVLILCCLLSVHIGFYDSVDYLDLNVKKSCRLIFVVIAACELYCGCNVLILIIKSTNDSLVPVQYNKKLSMNLFMTLNCVLSNLNIALTKLRVSTTYLPHKTLYIKFLILFIQYFEDI